ncbi:hypothetical protein BDZ97DRAFT_1762536 [Flammula alnicola]|nr:hypothetical protein BDZ97DRAFT_1762536 [Flammula alnicola]
MSVFKKNIDIGPSARCISRNITGMDDSGRKCMKRISEFWEERNVKNRSITDIDWSPKYPELSVASYNKNPVALNEPDGIVACGICICLNAPSSSFTHRHHYLLLDLIGGHACPASVSDCQVPADSEARLPATEMLHQLSLGSGI